MGESSEHREGAPAGPVPLPSRSGEPPSAPLPPRSPSGADPSAPLPGTSVNGGAGARVSEPRFGSHLGVFLRQLPFLGVTSVLALGMLAYGPETVRLPGFAAGLLVAVAASVLALVIPWRRLPLATSAVVPLADIAAVGLLIAGGFRASTLLVLPVLWLATVFGAPGVVVSVVAATLAAWGPDLFAPQIQATDVQRLIILPMVLTAVGVAAHLAERRSAARLDLLGRQSALIEETLAESHQQSRVLDSILNTIDVGVVALDRDGRITIINRAHAAATEGRLRIGDHVSVSGGIDGYAEDRRTPLGAEGSPLVRAGRGEDIDRELTWWDSGGGTWLAYRVSAAQLHDVAGRRSGAVVVYQDLTAEMAALAQREDFVSSVSHELRTPLTSVLGYLELASDDPTATEAVRAHLRVAERNAERLLHLVSDLLLAARTRERGVEFDREVVDLRNLVAETVQSQLPHAQTAGLAIRHHLTEPCRVLGDRTRLGQVVDNVLSNAIKYTPAGGEVEVTLRPAADVARVTISDTGIGIAGADQDKLFTRFFRAPAVRNGAVVGTGLGLHLSRQIVEAHGGTIELTSALGAGTSVEIRLPVTDPAHLGSRS
jgi:two-component system, OmpR family, phosphate regulon sensor histidine kinase PhoR